MISQVDPFNKHEQKAPKSVAVVLVHGIGDLRSGDVVGSAIRAIEKAAPGARIVTMKPEAVEPDSGQAQIHSTDIQWHDARIRVVEFYWAGIAGKIRLRRPIDAIRKTLRLVREFPSVALRGSE